MTVTAVDADGNVATGFRGTVFITSSDPAATLDLRATRSPRPTPGTHTFTGAIRLVTAGDPDGDRGGPAR